MQLMPTGEVLLAAHPPRVITAITNSAANFIFFMLYPIIQFLLNFS